MQMHSRTTAEAAAAASESDHDDGPPRSSSGPGIVLPRDDGDGVPRPLPIARLDADAHREEEETEKKEAGAATRPDFSDGSEEGPPPPPSALGDDARGNDDDDDGPPLPPQYLERSFVDGNHGVAKAVEAEKTAGDDGPPLPPQYVEQSFVDGNDGVAKAAKAEKTAAGAAASRFARGGNVAPAATPYEYGDAAVNEKIAHPDQDTLPSYRTRVEDPSATAAVAAEDDPTTTVHPPSRAPSVPVPEATPVDERVVPVQIAYLPPPGPVIDGVVVDDGGRPWWKEHGGKILIVGSVLLLVCAAVAVATVLSSASGGGEEGEAGTGAVDAAATPRPTTPGARPPKTHPPSLRPPDRGGDAQNAPTAAPPGRSPPSPPPSRVRLVWEQLGRDIDGLAPHGQFGKAVALSANGTTVAIGSPFHDATDFNDDSGSVRIYNWDDDDSRWRRAGRIIWGEMWDWSGWSVDLSADGNVVAIGAIYNQCDNDGSGVVRVHEFDEGTASWNLLGSGIQGENPYDASGASVSLSGDGRTVAIGSPLNEHSSGHVRVYSFEEIAEEWVQLGRSINGTNEGDGLGFTLALSADGVTLAVGSPFSDDNSDDSGSVMVYRWNDITVDWDRLGRAIRGESAGDQAGFSASLSAYGAVLAVGAPHSYGGGSQSGSTRIYEWNENATDWEPLGQSIDGVAAGDQVGSSVALSADGGTVAVGANLDDGRNGEDSGSVRVYRLDRGAPTPNWVRVGRDIEGEAAGDWSGRSVALSADGSIVAIGAMYNDGNGTDSGHARVFHLTE